MSLGVLHFRDRESRVIRHTIVRISSSSMTQGVQGCKALIKTWCLVLTNSAALVSSLPCSIIFPVVPHPSPQEDDAKFREVSKRAGDGPSRAGRLSKKRFLMYP